MKTWILFVTKHSVLFLLLTFGLFVLACFFVKDLNVEAFPDPAPPVLEIVTLDLGKSAEELERQITIPTEIALAGMPHLEKINTISLYGLSDIKCKFSYNISYHDAKQEILNRLSGLSLPDNATPSVVSNMIGECLRYTVEGSQNLMELRTLQDWVISRHILTADGVEDNNSYGGYIKTYNVKVFPEDLIKYGIPLSQVLTALSASNLNVGAHQLEMGDQYYVVRGRGLIQSLSDIENTLVTTKNGKPVIIKNLAQVTIGNVPRTGIMGLNYNDESVMGIVVLRKDAQSIPSLKSIHEKIKELNDHILPKGIHVHIFYDRWDLILTVVNKVLHTASIGIILVTIALFLFLGDLWGALIVALSIPISLIITLSIMAIRGESANLLSLGAIDYGIIVDIPLILMENYYRISKQHGPGATSIVRAAQEVDIPIFFSVLIIFLAFLPLFMMQGAEGQIFAPMAKTYLYAILITLVLTFTFLIASQYTFLGKSLHREFGFVTFLRRKYVQVIQILRKRSTIVLFITVLVFSVNLFFGIRMLKTEFIPKMDEGNMLLRSTWPFSISLEKAFENAKKVRDLLMTYPEVQSVEFNVGRPEDGTDPTGPYQTEYIIPLKPYNLWTRKITKDQLEEMARKDIKKLFPNFDINMSQYITDQIEEVTSGIKGENSVKIYGTDLNELDRIGKEVFVTLPKIPGIEDVGIFRELGQPNLLIDVNRANASAMGLAVQDVLNVVQAALGGGQPVTQVIEGEKSFGLVVNFPPEYWKNPDKIGNIPLVLPDGSIVPLSRVANIHYDTGALFIFRENFKRFIPVKFTVTGNDLGGTVAQAQKEIAKIKMPEGYYVEWSGMYDEMQSAFHRFKITIPLTLFIILTILYIYFKSVKNIMITMFAPAFDIFGGVVSLLITGQSLSISSMVGFISIIGISILNASILISHYIDIHRSGRTKEEAAIEASEDRFRPVLMGGLIASLGLLPAALMQGVGSQVVKPLAIVVVGGMSIDTLMILLVMPLLLKYIETNNE